MAVHPTTILQIAEGLANLAQNEMDGEMREAVSRAAIDRAYLAAYHATLAVAIEQGYEPGIGSGHHQLWVVWCRRQGWNETVGFEGEELRDKRTRADYKIDRELRDDPMKAVAQAKRIFALISTDMAS